MKHTLLVLLMAFVFFSLHAQEENWDAYLAQYPKGPGSTVLDMELKNKAPFKDFPFLLKTGVSFKHCTDQGMPTDSMFATLYTISDSVKAVVSLHKKNILAGSFTYQCSRYDYYYLSDTLGIREELNSMYANHFPAYEALVMLREDKPWEAYLQFLYPNEETREYMSNQQLVMQLQQAGDNLQQERQVDHWLYFATEKDRDCFVSYVQQNGFSIEGKNKTDQPGKSWQLHVSRTDKVDLAAISKLTMILRKEAARCRGDYDGWETFVIK